MVIDSFTGRYRFLSNFAPSPLALAGLVFPSVEHAFQAFKSPMRQHWELVAGAPTPGRAKRAGRALPLRDDWDAIKIPAMEMLVRLKFARHPDLARLLAATGDAELIEGNTWGDRFWGVCGGVGRNELGKILMRVRAEKLPVEQH